MTKYRLKRDITKDPRQRYPFSKYMQALDDVFHSVFFRDVELRNILWDSYRINLWGIALYAVKHGIDEIEHIKSIQQELLKIPGCLKREERKKMSKTLNLNLEREILCPLTGGACEQLATVVVEYANYLANLAQKNSSDIFTNGGKRAPNCCETCNIYEIYGGKYR